MKKIKIAIILGTRPEVIKLAPIIQNFKKYKKNITTYIIATAQHRQMLDSTLKTFSIKTQYDLNIMEENQTLSNIVSKTSSLLEQIFSKIKPDLILVQGDTTTAFIGSLIGFYHKIKIGHIEAGLRTYEKYFPFPEEINRQIISIISDFHFTPTKKAAQNLLKEGIKKEKIFITGNTIIDALHLIVEKKYKFKEKVLNKIDYENKKIILVTTHRRENFGNGLKNICLALENISNKNKNVEIVFPVHLNPNITKYVNENLSSISTIHLTSPLCYKDLINVMKKSYIILTDSGGIQEEAPELCKPVLVLRDVTERPEGVEMGVVKLVGTNKEKIIKETNKLLKNKNAYNKMIKKVNPYGDGKASQRIIDIILQKFNIIKKRKTKDWKSFLY
ncbi:MAG: UDP-N-acetylglucosamine 2-epimerase (non-hydrolyzing) [bacterium]